MTFKPPKLEDVEAYVKEKNLAVDPEWFWNFFDAGNWIDTRGNPVKSWKQKLWTHHRMTLERGGMPKCGYSGCKKPGVYIIGKDRDGHPNRYCVDHKPKPKPLPKELVPNMKQVESCTINFNDKRNEQHNKLRAEG